MATLRGFGLKAYSVLGPLVGAKVYKPSESVISKGLMVEALSLLAAAILAGQGRVEIHGRDSKDFP